ncbi:MAG: hypothetical protein IT317_18385 [Anaerolineales bacterium]|nr:hypothetical protein [Anaerolineales bacterium]
MATIWRTLPTERVRQGGPALVVGLIVLTAAARWWRPDLPAGADTAVHLLRAVELDWAMRHGSLYPRWAPDLVFGFGYPLFSVYGLGAPAVIVGLHALGASFRAATLLTFALADVAGALGAYALARRLWATTGALVAAAAYAYAPYVLGSLARGSAAEALALGALPWLGWALLSLWRAAGAGWPSGVEARWLAAVAGLYALLPLFHNPTAVLASVLAAAALAVAGAGGWREAAVRRKLALAAGALGAGLLLSAFYWLPLLVEARDLQLERGYSANVLNFHFNFLDWLEVLAWPRAFDPKVIGVSAPRSLGWPQVGLGLAALAAWRWQPPERRRWLLWLALGVLGLALLTLSPAVWVWDRVPGLGLLQFPARLLGPASLLLALLGGAAAALLERPGLARWQAPLAGLAVGAVLVYGLPWTFGHGDRSLPDNPALADLHAWEQRTGTIGTTTAGEYLPRWIQAVPPPERLAAAYAEGAPPRRLDPSSLPAGSAVRAQAPRLLGETVTIEAPSEFEAVFNVFYFPGWRARVDGAAARIAITAPHGLIGVPVPAGRHTVAIDFGTTPPRVMGGLISAAGVLALVGLAWLGRAARPAAGAAPAEGARGALLACAVASLAVLAFKLGVADRGPTPFARTRFDGATVAGVQAPLALDFGGQLELLGFDPGRPGVPSGGTLAVTLYWRALQPPSADYSVSLVVEDSEGQRYAQSDALHPAGYPTSRWGTDAYAVDAHRLELPPGTPPGLYTLRAHLYRYPDLAAVTPSLALGAVAVARPSRPADFTGASGPRAVFGPIELLGAALGAGEVGAGGELPLTWYWRTAAAPQGDLQARVALVAPDGTLAAEQTMPPVRADYDTAQWAPGETLLARRTWRLPAGAPSGMYTVTVALVDGGKALGQPAPMGLVRVTAPERLWAPPPVEHRLGARFGGLAELVGWTLRDDMLTLVWQALATAERSHSVFVHVRGADGALYSQHDAPPVGGTRPTTSWLAGEYLVDTHVLNLPAGAFSLAVGLYDPRTGERLALAGGEDALVLEP